MLYQEIERKVDVEVERGLGLLQRGARLIKIFWQRMHVTRRSLPNTGQNPSESYCRRNEDESDVPFFTLSHRFSLSFSFTKPFGLSSCL